MYLSDFNFHNLMFQIAFGHYFFAINTLETHDNVCKLFFPILKGKKYLKIFKT